MTARVALTLTLAGLLTVTAGPVGGDDKTPAAPKSSYERLKILAMNEG